MLALAAALWLVYLIPSWLKNREYVATERNAVRLQQTLRVLAETAEVPKTVRAEATARSVAEHERSLRIQQARADRERVTIVDARERVAASQPSAARRLRRTRAITSLVLVASIGIFLTQLPTLLSAGMGSTGGLVALFAGIAGFSSWAMLSRLSAVAKSRVAPVAVPVQVARRVSMSPRQQADAAPAPRAQWTPVPVPKPLYLSRATVDAEAATAAAIAAELERAAREAERALRAAHAEPEVTAFRPREEAPASAPSRFASMGQLDEKDLARPNIDEVLRRRRAAG